MTTRTLPLETDRKAAIRRFLLACGIVSSLWYVVLNIIVPMFYDGYSMSSLTVSELSAIGAPTRKLWVALVIPYLVLFAAFGWGVLQAASNNRHLFIVGWIILVYAAFNTYWPPMHQRGNEPTLTDTLHIVWAAVTVLLMIVMMVVGSAAFGRGFKVYTLTSLVMLLLFGILTGLESPNIPTNGPTPWIGVWERINIGVFLLWVVALAVVLLKKEKVIHEQRD